MDDDGSQRIQLRINYSWNKSVNRAIGSVPLVGPALRFLFGGPENASEVPGYFAGILPGGPCISLAGKSSGFFTGLINRIFRKAEKAGATEAGAAASRTVKTAPYNVGGGHHIPAKSSLIGAPGYNAGTALAIPASELERLGVMHPVITGAQAAGYRTFAATGAKLTWEAVENIEINALVKAGLAPDVAENTVKPIINMMQSSGLVPTRIPWSR